jgi:putative endonuclease
MRTYYIYIITNKYNTVYYTWVTNNLLRRLYEHKNKINDWFTQRYNVYKLLYYEEFSDIRVAINREKEIKKRRREKKINLIKTKNSTLRDIYSDFF